MKCAEPRDAGAIDRLVLGATISGFRFRRLWRHLGECETCRAYYDRAALVWREMGGSDEPTQISEALATQLSREVAAREGVAKRGWWSGRSLSMLSAATGIMAVAALAIATSLRTSHPAADRSSEWTERGAQTNQARRVRGVRAFCLGASTDGGASVLGSTASAADPSIVAATPLHCPQNGSLQFAYTLGPGAPAYLVLLGSAAGSPSYQYEPAPDQATATMLRPVTDDEPFSSSIRLRAVHHPGVVRVQAYFSERPVAAAAIRALVDQGKIPGAGDGISERQELRIVVDP